MRRQRRALLIALAVALVFSIFHCVTGVNAAPEAAAQPAVVAGTAPASPAGVPDTAPLPHGEEALPKVLLILLIILALAKLGGDLFERMGQPAVLGELIFGIVMGNLSLLNIGWAAEFARNVVQDPQTSAFVTLLGQVGVVLLLFEVGLQSTVNEMMSVGVSSFLVAVLGVAAPMALGFVVGEMFLPHEPWTVDLFLGAVLAATSVGITARVLRDLNRMHLRESQIILGAAVIDDILGLVVLAVAQGIISAVNSGTRLEAYEIVSIVAKAIGFFFAAIMCGLLVSKRIYRWASTLRRQGVLLSLSLVWCFLVAYLGTLFGLAPIVGAFAAGLVLEDATFKDFRGDVRELEDLLSPITAILVPVFFVNMGMKVDLSAFGTLSILGFAGTLTLAAILGKQVCSFGAIGKGLNRVAIGIGMIPRGEVGLIIANIGLGLRTAEGKQVISNDTFSATVIMVVVTTMITPPMLKWALERTPGKSGGNNDITKDPESAR